MPVVRTDGRSGGRSVYGHVISKFSCMASYDIFLPMVLRCARFARKSSAIKLPVARNTIPPTNRADERSNRLVEQFGSPGPPLDHAFAEASNVVGVNSRIQPYLQGEVRQKKIHTEKKNL